MVSCSFSTVSPTQSKHQPSGRWAQFIKWGIVMWCIIAISAHYVKTKKEGALSDSLGYDSLRGYFMMNGSDVPLYCGSCPFHFAMLIR